MAGKTSKKGARIITEDPKDTLETDTSNKKPIDVDLGNSANTKYVVQGTKHLTGKADELNSQLQEYIEDGSIANEDSYAGYGTIASNPVTAADASATPAQRQNEVAANGKTRGQSRRYARLADALNARNWSTHTPISLNLDAGTASGGERNALNMKQLNTQEQRNQARAEQYEQDYMEKTLNRQDLIKQFPVQMEKLKQETLNMLRQGIDQSQIDSYIKAYVQYLGQWNQSFMTDEAIRSAGAKANYAYNIENPAIRHNVEVGLGLQTFNPALTRMEKLYEKYNNAKTLEEKKYISDLIGEEAKNQALLNLYVSSQTDPAITSHR